MQHVSTIHDVPSRRFFIYSSIMWTNERVPRVLYRWRYISDVPFPSWLLANYWGTCVSPATMFPCDVLFFVAYASQWMAAAWLLWVTIMAWRSNCRRNGRPLNACHVAPTDNVFIRWHSFGMTFMFRGWCWPMDVRHMASFGVFYKVTFLWYDIYILSCVWADIPIARLQMTLLDR